MCGIWTIIGNPSQNIVKIDNGFRMKFVSGHAVRVRRASILCLR